MKTQYNMTELPENLSDLIRGNIVEKTLNKSSSAKMPNLWELYLQTLN